MGEETMKRLTILILLIAGCTWGCGTRATSGGGGGDSGAAALVLNSDETSRHIARGTGEDGTAYDYWVERDADGGVMYLSDLRAVQPDGPFHSSPQSSAPLCSAPCYDPKVVSAVPKTRKSASADKNMRRGTEESNRRRSIDFSNIETSGDSPDSPPLRYHVLREPRRDPDLLRRKPRRVGCANPKEVTDAGGVV